MTMEEKVQAILIASPPVTALVPASRIMTPGGNTQNVAKPYVVHFPVAPAGTTLTHSGLAVLQECDVYQISIFADKYSSGRNISKAILGVLQGTFSDGTTINPRGTVPRYIRDDETETDQMILEFDIHEELNLS